MARDSIVASTDVGSPWRVRDNAIRTIANAGGYGSRDEDRDERMLGR